MPLRNADAPEVKALRPRNLLHRFREGRATVFTVRRGSTDEIHSSLTMLVFCGREPGVELRIRDALVDDAGLAAGDREEAGVSGAVHDLPEGEGALHIAPACQKELIGTYRCVSQAAPRVLVIRVDDVLWHHTHLAHLGCRRQ